MYDCPPCDSTVNFTVWESEGGDGWVNDGPFAGLNPATLPGGGALDGSSGYLYLYQVINTNNDKGRLDDFIPEPLRTAGVPEEPLADFQILNRETQQVFSSGGFFDAVFQDSNPVLGSANGNNTITDPDYAGDSYAGSTQPPVDDPAPDMVPDPPRNRTPPSDHQPSSKGVSGVSLTSALSSQYVAPTSVSLYTGVDLDFDMISDAIAASFNWSSMDFLTGETSPVLFLTSNLGPIYDWGSTRSYNSAFGGDPADNPWAGLPPLLFGANGDIPTGVPAPATLTLAVLGLCLLEVRRRKARSE
jgi:hypothetical protein